MSLTVKWRNGVAYISGTVGGRRIRTSLKTSDAKSAEILCAETEARLLRESVYGKGKEETFADAALKYFKAGRSPRFVAALVTALGRRRLNTIQPGDLKQLAMELYPDAKGATRNRCVLTPAKAIINHAAELGLCHHIRVRSFPVTKVIRHAVDRTWIDAFSAKASKRLAALALFNYTTGARMGDSVRLEPQHFDLDNKRATLGRTKTGDPRVFYLTDELVEILRVLPPRRVDNGKGPWKVFGYSSTGSAYNQWRKACQAAGIPYHMPHEAGRHSFATDALVRKGLDPVTVAELGGWRDPTVLLRVYGHGENLGAIAEQTFGTKLAQGG
jgi:integrase